MLTAVWDVSPLEPPSARVYGDPSPADIPKLKAMSRSMKARATAWFLSHHRPITVHDLAQALGIDRSESLGPRVTELVDDGVCERLDILVPGPRGVSVHLYVRKTQEVAS